MKLKKKREKQTDRYEKVIEILKNGLFVCVLINSFQDSNNVSKLQIHNLIDSTMKRVLA
jgi:hypothetical protein